MKKLFSWILSVLLVFSLFSFRVNARDDLGDVYVENDSESHEEIELSDVNPDFYESVGEVRPSPLTVDDSNFKITHRSSLPSSYDLRTLNRVTPIRDQGPNGSCWAFATYGAMESYLTRFGQYDFSEKHLRNTHGFDWGPNDGGNREITAAYLARWSGPIDEKDDPYSPYAYSSPSNLTRVMDIDSILFIPDMKDGNDTRAIKEAIMQYGGVYTNINGNENMDFPKFNSHYDPGYGKANHAVVIVGWIDDFPATNFRYKAPGNGAWIVRNSWGTRYLDNGYYYVSYYDAHCGRSNAVFIPKDMDRNGKIYQYDPLGATRSFGYRNEGYMANVYRADDNETLVEVGLFNVAYNSSYDIYLVNDVKNTSDFQNGKKIATGKMGLPGYYTLDVDKSQIKKGEQFAIVVYMYNPSYTYPLAIEAPFRNFSSRARAYSSQSFVSSDGKSWSDLTTQLANTNACIKAITTTDANFVLDENDKEDTNVVKVNGISLNYTKGWIYKGKYAQLKATISPANATNKNVKFVSDDERIVRVDANGLVYGVNVGTTNVYAITEDGEFKASCEVTVKSTYTNRDVEAEKEDFSVKKDKITLNIGDELDVLELVDANESVLSNLNFEVMDKNVLELVDGKIRALEPGVSVLEISLNDIVKRVEVEVLNVENEKNYDAPIVEYKKSGILTQRFYLNIFQNVNGEKFRGRAVLELTSGNKTVKSNLYFVNGVAKTREFGLFDFKSENRDFVGKIIFEDGSVEFEFSR